jgi:hypothetical protein
MANEKVTSSEFIKPRRRIELHDLALAVSYSVNHPFTRYRAIRSIPAKATTRQSRPTRECSETLEETLG